MAAAMFPSFEEVVVAGRIADVLAAAELSARAVPPTRRDLALPDRLRIVYLLVRSAGGEGERLMLAQAQGLAALGADVIVLSRQGAQSASGQSASGQVTDPADPPRAEEPRRAEERSVPHGEAITDAVPPCDLIVAGSWELVLPACMLGFAPVVLFEDGELHVLGDVPERVRALIGASLGAASITIAPSEAVRRTLAADFGIVALADERGAGPSLLDQYLEVIGTSPAVVPVAGFDVRLGGLHFARKGDSARLRARLGSCTTKEVALPVSQPAFDVYRAVRWRVIARRGDGEEGTTRVYLPARSDRLLDDAPHQEGLDLLRAGRADEALDAFVARCERATPAEQAVLGRWVVVAMIAAGRPRDAAEVARAFAHDFPVQPDYVMLAVRAERAARRPVEITRPLARVRLLGVGARYDEWFEDPYSLMGDEG